MAVAAVCRIEDQIRTKALTRGIRPDLFFIDYDNLRSGYVTASRFFRILWESMGIKLTEEDERLLAEKYAFKKDGNVNYRTFCKVIEQPFNPNDLSADPATQTVQAKELHGTSRTLPALSQENEARIESLLRQLEQYYKTRGINLRSSCSDFDTHNIGLINESQFYRSMPKPPEMNDEDVQLLVRKYRDPDQPGLLNYINFDNDLEAIRMEKNKEGVTSVTQVADMDSNLPPERYYDPTLQDIFDKMRVAVFKNGVRSIDFFRDYDHLRSGIVTEPRFVSALVLAMGKEAQLSRTEIQKVVEYYRTPDGRIQYKELCDMLENAFQIPEFEKKPTQNVVRPGKGTLGRNLPELTMSEERRVTEILNTLAEQVRKRRIMVYQYFKDYDRSIAYSRIITPTQFGRILHFLTLEVSPQDFKLLCRKFADARTGDVNYPGFVQAIDSDFTNYIHGKQEEAPYKVYRPKEEPPVDTSGVSYEDLMALIRNYVLVNRIRVSEHFEDYDPLRSGSISKSRFRRCLSGLGLSPIEAHSMTDAQFEALAQCYVNPAKPDEVLWTKFMKDVETVFTQPNLERHPDLKVPPQEIFRVPKPGTMQWQFATPEHNTFVSDIMDRWRARTNERRVLVAPVFKDFDRHNNGHITRGQFRQSLKMLDMSATEPEMEALEAKFCNDYGFNYMQFLAELEPTELSPHLYMERLNSLRETNHMKKVPEDHPVGDLESVLNKVKTKVFRERMRIHEWTHDYDKLRSGRMSKINFRRALDLCGFGLCESELAILEDHYQSGCHRDSVDYLRFNDDIESIFTTKNLEKAPMLEVKQFRAPEDWATSVLTPEKEGYVLQAMKRLAEKVRETRVQLYPLFEDYDIVHNGTVTLSQFRRVLNELELTPLVSGEHEWVAMNEKFGMRVGGKDMLNYNAFCDTMYDLAGFEWRKP